MPLNVSFLPMFLLYSYLWHLMWSPKSIPYRDVALKLQIFSKIGHCRWLYCDEFYQFLNAKIGVRNFEVFEESFGFIQFRHLNPSESLHQIRCPGSVGVELKNRLCQIHLGKSFWTCEKGTLNKNQSTSLCLFFSL